VFRGYCLIKKRLRATTESRDHGGHGKEMTTEHTENTERFGIDLATENTKPDEKHGKE
jgi:hypothetical protein